MQIFHQFHQPASLTLKKGPVASTGNQFSGQSFVFNIPEDKSQYQLLMELHFLMILRYMKGTYLDQTFTYSSRNPFQKFILPNTGIDLDTLVVKVKPSASSNCVCKYQRHDNLFDSDSGSSYNGKFKHFFHSRG